jgi:xylulose-5-phosphate/fructose-6-phosphate phosphoketolase
MATKKIQKKIAHARASAPASPDRRALAWLPKYLRYVDYISAAQLYLKENFFLRRELKPTDIKERILGHWGTVPGLNFIYAHLDYLIYKHHPSMMYLVGPGHGAPAVIANLFAEKTLAEYYPELQRGEEGTGKLIKMFSWPGGFPSHVNPATPGAILEGGELGYSLATSYGAVMDNPDLIVACVVGDGEAETGPLATAWHGNKFLNPKTSGAVLPILHVNGYKITGPTIFGTMSDEELKNLFTGYGYEPLFVDIMHPAEDQPHQQMIKTLEYAYQKIREIQKKARSSKKPLLKPRWPMIVLRSLKGWTGIKYADGHKIEGTYHAHGIPIGDPRTNPEHFKLVKNWLESYKFSELVDAHGAPLPEVVEFVPKGDLRMGMNKHSIGGNMMKKLKLPDQKKYRIYLTKRGDPQIGNTGIGAEYIRDIIAGNPTNFRFYCPDETESNKFGALFEVTKRAFMWPVKSFDENIGPDGRVMEVLSEHNLQGWMQGYVLTGRHGIFATYEAFATIIASMVDQYAKFLKQSAKVLWRKPVPSLNYLLTSVGWRQEHNGYSHQNPSFISGILEKHGKFCSVYFPADANQLLVILEDCFKRTDSINVIVAGKQIMPQWLTLEEAREELKVGVGTWYWIDKKAAKNPDVVMAAAGDALVQESMAAISLLQKLMPELKIRFVNVSELTALGVGDEKHPLSLSHEDFCCYFTEDKPIIFNFHGYPEAIRKLIFGRDAMDRISVHGYEEEGTTTTPFNMMVMNKTDRFNLCIDVLEKAAKQNPKFKAKADELTAYFLQELDKHARYIIENGKDMPEIENWHWTRPFELVEMPEGMVCKPHLKKKDQEK